MDNTTFGGDIPPLPQWTGPPHAMIQVQAMLYASLAASLFAAFLAMLGKQWLNRYASTDMRGTGIERSQDRQRKLNGIITWYFDHVMESLPLMLQFALLLLGCALSRYLWEINVTVMCVVVSVTALGVVFYAFVVVAGTAFESCPYRTPVARVLRHILYHILPSILGSFHSTFCNLIHGSACVSNFPGIVWHWWEDWVCFILFLPYRLAYDIFQLTRAMVRGLTSLVRRVSGRIRNARSTRACGLDQRAAVLDSQCISWILRTSLENGIRLSTLKFLVMMPTLADFTPALISDCFNILVDCAKVNNMNAVIVQGMEQLAEVSAMCFFLAYSHLSAMDPMPSVLVDIRQCYRRVFPRDVDFSDLPFPHTFGLIHTIIYSGQRFDVPIEWRDYKPSNHEHVTIARAFSKLSWSHKREFVQLPSSCLSFARHYLSQDPLPPLPIIANCLLIFAIDLGCNVPNTMVSGEVCSCLAYIYQPADQGPVYNSRRPLA
jgi:hypothetical protein